MRLLALCPPQVEVDAARGAVQRPLDARVQGAAVCRTAIDDALREVVGRVLGALGSSRRSTASKIETITGSPAIAITMCGRKAATAAAVSSGSVPLPVRLVAFIGANDDRRTRVYSYAAGMPATQEQRERRNAATADFAREFPGVPVAPVFNWYGVPYQIMYAAAAAGGLRQGRLTGADLARGIGMTQKAGARRVYVGRRDLAIGLADAAIGPIALQNLHPGHPLNWSHNSFGAPMVDNARVYCFTRNPSTGALVETFAGQVWNRQTDSLTGTFVPCP